MNRMDRINKVIEAWLNYESGCCDLLIADKNDNALIQFNKVIGLIVNGCIYVNIEKYTGLIDDIQSNVLSMIERDGYENVILVDSVRIDKLYRCVRYDRLYS